MSVQARRAGIRRLVSLALVAVVGVLAAGVLALVPAASASAHDFLVSSTPMAGSTITAPPSTVTLTFNDLVLDLSGDSSSAVVEVTGPDAQTTHFETGCASILGRGVSVPVALGAGGSYEVSWQIVSSDGHPVSSSITFTYAPPAGTVAAAGSASAQACGTNVDPSKITALPNTAGTSGGSVSPWLIIGIAGGVVVLALVVVVVILVASRRPRESGA